MEHEDADADAGMAALGEIMMRGRPEFRGAIALHAPLPGWPTAITLLALEVWDGFSELSYVELPGPKPSGARPDRRLPNFVVTTDLDTVHRGWGGGGGTPGTDKLLAWHTTIAPSLPDPARLLHVHASMSGANAQTTIDLSTHPITRRSADVADRATTDGTDPDCPSCGPPAVAEQPPSPDACIVPDRRPSCARCRMNSQAVFAAKVPTGPQPDRVIALGAQLGSVFGTELVIPALVVWPGWFDLRIAGPSSGQWAAVALAPNRAGRWTAHDDLGRSYRGASTGGSSSVGLVHKDLSFIPGLATDATTLTVELPSAIDGQGRTATLDLRPEPASTGR